MAFAPGCSSSQPGHRLLRAAPFRVALAALLVGLAGGDAAPARRLPGLHRRGDIGGLDLSHIQHSNLGGHGPDKGTPPTIRFKDVSTVAGTFLDLVIEQKGGYTPFDVGQNHNTGHIGKVNVKAGTQVKLNLKFVQTGTDIPAPMGRLYLTVFLMDQREKVRVDYFGASATIAGFRSYCLSKETSLKAHVEEDPASITFTTPSGKLAQPVDPNDLSEAERKQAVTFFLHGAFEIPITIDVAGGDVKDAGLNFAFSGTNSISDGCHSWRPSALGGSGPDLPATTTVPASALHLVDTSGCEKICKVNGVSASCKARVDWVAENQYTDQANPCETAYSLVFDICPVCSHCSKEAACSAAYGASLRSPATTTTEEHHDCDEDFATWTTSWSKAKQEWCCETHNRACPTTKTHTTTSTSTTVPTTAEVTTTVTTVTYTTEPYDCSAGLAASKWSKEHIAWCCENYVIGCTVTTTTASTSTLTSGTTTTTTTSVQTETATITSTTSARYDCETDLFNWREAWSSERQEWCCEHQSRGCRPTTTEPFDCVRDFAKWETKWSDRKRGWCCEYHHRGCPPTTTQATDASRCGSAGCSATTVTTTLSEEFDCEDSYDEWATAWTYTKKAWCCQHHQKGCRFVGGAPTTTMALYDCEERSSVGSSSGLFRLGGMLLGAVGSGSPGGNEEWSREKTEWCCSHQNVRCPRTTAAPKVEDDVYSCRGDSDGWGYRRKTWCCQHYARGCTLGPPARVSTSSRPPHDCDVGLDEWALGWSDEKKLWCCTNSGKGCTPAPTPAPSEPFDCAAGYEAWASSWSYRKKAYCCRQYARGCHVSSASSEPSEPYSCKEAVAGEGSLWSTDRQDYCCRVYGTGCASTTSDLYDCTAGFSSWQIGWSVQKQQWCCKRYARGCGGAAPERQELLLADGVAPAAATTRQRASFSSSGSPQTARLFTSGGRAEPPRARHEVRWRQALARAPLLVVAASAGAVAAAAVAAAAWWRSERRTSRGCPCRRASSLDRYAPVDRDVEEPRGPIAEMLLE